MQETKKKIHQAREVTTALLAQRPFEWAACSLLA